MVLSKPCRVIMCPRAPMPALSTSRSIRARTRMLAAARARVTAGDLDLPMNAVAKDAGVGVGTMYRHFPSRQALLAVQSLAALVVDATRAAGHPDVAGGLAGLLRSALCCCQLTTRRRPRCWPRTTPTATWTSCSAACARSAQKRAGSR